MRAIAKGRLKDKDPRIKGEEATRHPQAIFSHPARNYLPPIVKPLFSIPASTHIAKPHISINH
jgi:hypothetical protein